MDWPKVNCPNCNALQDFKYKHRNLGDGVHETYVKCTKCKREWVTDKITDAELAKKRRRARAATKRRTG